MLLRFEVSNHRSIFDPVELSMIAVDEDRDATRAFDLLSERVLTVAGVYGPNASGKSNILEAIAWLGNAVSTSLRGWDDHVPRDAHRFDKGPSSPSTFEIDVVVDGVRHCYRLEVNDTDVLYESLCSYPERRRRTLYEREGDEVSFRRGIVGVGGIQELLTPTTLVLSAATRLRDPLFVPVGRFIGEFRALGLKRRRGRLPFTSVLDLTRFLFLESHDVGELESFEMSQSISSALELLSFADPGIVGIEVSEENEESEGKSRRELRFIHQDRDEPVMFDLSEESAGTQAWFHLLGPTIRVLERGRVLLFDEVDASLHPRLSARLIQLFQDPQTNPRGAQLIFTSHDTSLLNALNRDEVWFTNKQEDNATRLVALAEFGGDKVRKSLNLERAYLQGRFGAIPDLDHIDVRRALGHIEQAV